MRAVIQRVSSASVTIEKEIVATIGPGLLILLGIAEGDTAEDGQWLVGKIAKMRLFADSEHQINRSVSDIDGDILVVSQFTLYASTRKGNRPSFINAARPEIAIPLYETFVEQLTAETGKSIPTGRFGADMQIALINDGPVTIVIDSRLRE